MARLESLKRHSASLSDRHNRWKKYHARTASDVSIGQIDFLENIRLARKTATVQGVGGEGVFEVEGDFSLDEKCFLTLFAVSRTELPPGIVALIGNEHLVELGVSLDYAQAHPDAALQAAIRAGASHKEGDRSISSRVTLLAGIAGLLSSTLWAIKVSEEKGIQTFLQLALSLSLSLLVWMVLQWAHLPPLSHARPPVRDGAVAQAQTSPTDKEIRHALLPPRSHRTPRRAGFSAGQEARLDALLREHSPSYARHGPNRSRLEGRTRSRPRVSLTGRGRKKTYFSPRDREIPVEPLPREGSVLDLAGQARANGSILESNKQQQLLMS